MAYHVINFFDFRYRVKLQVCILEQQSTWLTVCTDEPMIAGYLVFKPRFLSFFCNCT